MSGLDETIDELGTVSAELERIEGLAAGVSRGLTNAFAGAVSEGRGFRTILSDIAKSFADIALRAAIKPLGDLAGSAIETLFRAGNPAIPKITPFAKGGVIARPSYFPLGDGLGLAGEAGPEAIVPLRRGPDGALGIGSAATAPITVSMTVNASDAPSFLRAEAEISAMLLRAARRGQRAS